MAEIVGVRRSIYRGLATFVVASLVAVTLVASGSAPARAQTYGEVAAQYARDHLVGLDYGFPGFDTSYTTVDCSSSVWLAWNSAKPGVVPAESAEGIYNYFLGKPETLISVGTSALAATDLLPGDLLFWEFGANSKNPEHVAIYLGSGQILQTSAATDPPKVSWLGGINDNRANRKPYAVRPTGGGSTGGGGGSFGTDTAGVWQAGHWFLNDQNDGSSVEHVFDYANATDAVLVGDWDGDGVDTIGVWRAGYWYLNNQNDGSAPEYAFGFGNSTDTPIVGDWDGNGTDTVGVWRTGHWFLNNQNDGSAVEYAFDYGNSNDTPIVGDWDGLGGTHGTDTVGVWQAGHWFLNNQNDGSAVEYAFDYGNSNDTPVVGDWDGNGTDTVGIWQAGHWFLNNQNDGSTVDYAFVYGNSTDTPVVGDWNGL